MSSVATRCVWNSNYVLDVANRCSDLDLALATGIPVSGEYPMKKHESRSCRRAFFVKTNGLYSDTDEGSFQQPCN